MNIVGASLLAMVVNDDAAVLVVRGGLRFFASRLAPTGLRTNLKNQVGRQAASVAVTTQQAER